MAEVFSPETLDSINGQTSSAVTSINDNFSTIASKLDDVLSLSGIAPNAMQSDLDMNSFTILNLPTPVNPTDPVRLQDLTTSGGGGSGGGNSGASIQTATLSLTSDEILALDIIPIQIIAAPGVGKVIIAVNVFWDYTFGTVDYAGANPDLFYGVTNDSSLEMNVGINFSGYTDDLISWFGYPATASVVSTLLDDVAIYVGTSGDIIDGDGSLKVIVNYMTITRF